MPTTTILSGPTDNSNVEETERTLKSYIGATIEVKLANEDVFAGTLKEIESIHTDDMHESKVGLKLTVEKRKLGDEITFSTSFRDDDMDSSSYLRQF